MLFEHDQRTINWGLVVVWMGVIFVLSAQPDLKTGLDTMWDTILRKLAHAVEYGVLGWLAIRALRRQGLALLGGA